MPAKSKNQATAMRIAQGVKEGKVAAKPGSPSAQIASSMSMPGIRDFASTPTAKLPTRVAKPTGKKQPVAKPKRRLW